MRIYILISITLMILASVAPAGFAIDGDDDGSEHGYAAADLSVSLGFDVFPDRYTCDGEDLSPPVEVGGLDRRAESVVMILEDPDAPRGAFVHWLIWNLVPASAIPEGIPWEGEVSAPEAVQGRNGFGSIGYRGPCPPPGAPHRYVLRVYALDSKLSLPPGSEMDDLVAAMEGHVLQSGEAAATRGG